MSDADPYAGDRARFEITTAREDARAERRATSRSLDPSELASEPRRRRSLVVGPRLRTPRSLYGTAARDRTVRGKVLAAVRSEQMISIDGTPAPFLTLTAATGHWVAVRTHSDLVITVAASDLDPTRIIVEPISDPAARFLGPKPSGADVWPE